MGLEAPLWRAVAVFRVAALGYAVFLLLNNVDRYRDATSGWLVIAVMAVWTSVTAYGYASPGWRGWPLLAVDFAVTAACLLASRWVVPTAALANGAATLPMAWVASPVLAWAVCKGRRMGAIAALGMGALDLVIRGRVTSVTLNGTALLLMAGVIVGHVARLTVEAQERFQRATELEAATRERERLARGIHDSVLQVLALVQRRGAALGGEAAELGRLAGEQEITLRALVSNGGRTGPGGLLPGGDQGVIDLAERLRAHASLTISVATPADAVPLPADVATEVDAAVACALDNVRVHCGPEAHAWVLVEDEPDSVTVSVRDDGPGIPEGRLAEAAAAGRLGVAQSIQGRIRELGGTVTILTVPGTGTEIELRVPRG